MGKILQAHTQLKGWVLFFAALLVSNYASANNAQDAVNKAVQFFSSTSTGTRKQVSSSENLTVKYQSTNTKDAQVYVIQKDQGGFVIISQNDQASSIIGYAPTGNYDVAKLSPTFQSLLVSYQQTIPEKTPILSGLTDPLKTATPLLDQAGIALNQYTHSNVGNCPSGCVATALAQIVAYHQYPAKGKGSYCYTPKTKGNLYGELCVDFENTTYNWTNPTDDDYKLLSYHIGVATGMDYCASSSGSSPSREDHISILEQYFGYSYRNGTRDIAYIKTEIDELRPVYLGLFGDPAHAVVIDGYNDDNYLHLSFGWGGNANGYYLMNTNSTFWVGYTFGTNLAQVVFYSTQAFTTQASDSLALITINEQLQGGTGWDTSLPVCKWSGVITHKERVVELTLGTYENEVNGSIANEIANLTALRKISIAGGKLDGEITADIFNLPEIESIIISKKSGTSTLQFPTEITGSQKLTYLYIPGIMTGEIPSSISQMSKIQHIDISKSTLSAHLPTAIGTLSNLTYLDISNNNIEGELPSNIGDLQLLELLNLSENKLSGTIPSTIGNLTKIKQINLNNNALSGTVPDAFNGLDSLKVLDLFVNNLQGALPESIGKLKKIEKLNIHANQITALPTDMTQLVSLTELDVSENKLTSLPISLNQLKSLLTIDASHNEIDSLDKDFGSISKLQSLNLSYNKLTEIPSGIFFNTKMYRLIMNDNELTTFPSSIDFMTLALEYINFENNNLSGKIPLNLLTSNCSSGLMLTNNRFIFDDIPVSDNIMHAVGNQKIHTLTKNRIPVTLGDTVRIDIRTLSRLQHIDNQYYWIEYPKYLDNNSQVNINKLTPDPILTLVINEETASKKYYCKVFNDSVPLWNFHFNDYVYKNPTMDYVNTDTIGFELVSEDELLTLRNADSYFINSKNIVNTSISDNTVTLITPIKKYRGNSVWQASTNGTNWHDVSTTMNDVNLRKNIVTCQPVELVISPLTDAFYRTAVYDDNCDPIYSDTVHIKAYGDIVCDSIINTTEKEAIIKLKDIEITIPKGIHPEDFRITILKLATPPASPENTTRMSDVYDVSVSFGSTFYLPILVKFKDLNKDTFDNKDIEKFVAMYYDDTKQEWVQCEQGNISLQDTTLNISTYHFTKLTWFELAHKSYTHIFSGKYVNVIYKYGDGYPESNFYYRYNIQTDAQGKKYWHNSNNDPDTDPNATPYLIQDIAHYMDSIIHKFKDLGIETPSLRFNVYAALIGNNGMTDAGSYLAGRGYFYIDPQYVSYDLSQDENRKEMMRTLAHEYMHYTQDYYMTVLLQNYYWMEATAPIAARIVWEDDLLDKTESDLLIEDALYPEKEKLSIIQHILMMGRNKTIFEVLSDSWLSNYNIPVATKIRANSADANLSALFLHYMQNLRTGKKLDAALLLKETTYFDTWIEYLDGFVQKHLEKSLGEEYSDYVRYLLTGDNQDFTLLNFESGSPFKHIIKNSDNENLKGFALRQVYKFEKSDKTPQTDTLEFSLPYLASKVLLLSNTSINQLVVVNYKTISQPDEHHKVYYGRFDSKLNKVEFVDISDSISYNILLNSNTQNALDDSRNTSFLLFVNTKSPTKTDFSTDFDASFELTARPVIAFTDVDYLTVGTDFIHTYSDTSLMPFMIYGAKNTLNLGVSSPLTIEYFTVNLNTHTITIMNDSTYRVNVEYSSSQCVHENNPELPASIRHKHITQQIDYNYIIGTLSIVQTENTTDRRGAYYDSFIEVYYEETLGSIQTKNTRITLQNVFEFTQATENRLLYSTANTTETKQAIVSMSDSWDITNYYTNGEISNSSSRNYVSTNFQESDVNIYLWVHYDE